MRKKTKQRMVIPKIPRSSNEIHKPGFIILETKRILSESEFSSSFPKERAKNKEGEMSWRYSRVKMSFSKRIELEEANIEILANLAPRLD